jgi:outer membrane protein OmpA-like peptidoglycan-associated protein
MKKFFCLLIVLLFSNALSSQGKRDTLQLFYDINVAQSDANGRRIDSLCNTLKGKVFNAWVYGYADFLHTNDYNAVLSKKRAEWVKARLQKNSGEPQMTILACEGRGENASKENGSSKGEWFQRRVDLVFEVRPPNRVVDTRPVMLSQKDTLKKKKPAAPSIDVDELKSKGKIALEGLGFIPGRSTLLPSSMPVLEGLLKTLQENPDLRIEIQGHICCWNQSGDAHDYDTNDNRLSTNRARTVYKYLVENGIEDDRLKYKGYGHTRPREVEDSPENEQKNRRVEIKVLE